MRICTLCIACISNVMIMTCTAQVFIIPLTATLGENMACGCLKSIACIFNGRISGNNISMAIQGNHLKRKPAL